MIPFLKMHGTGNDFLVVREADLPPGCDASDLARRACDRHFGVGADGLLVYGPRPARDGLPRLRMLYWNADGSRAEMCGNGARCVVRAAHERGEVSTPLVLETDAGDRPARVRGAGARTVIEIDMGAAIWDPVSVPVQADAPLVAAPVRLGDATLEVSAVSMGNPHAVVFVPDLESLARVALATMGRALAEHPIFPRGANASFVAVVGDDLHLRIWERGVGPTLACGTATCAAFAAASRSARLTASAARVHLPGGTVEVRETPDRHLWLAGPAAYVAAGTLAAELLG